MIGFGGKIFNPPKGLNLVVNVDMGHTPKVLNVLTIKYLVGKQFCGEICA